MTDLNDNFDLNSQQDGREPHLHEERMEASGRVNRVLLVCAAVLIALVLVGLGYAAHETRGMNRLTEANTQLGAQLTEAQNQLTSLKTRLAALQAAPPAPAPVQQVPVVVKKQPLRHHVARRLAYRPRPRRKPGVPVWGKKMQQQLTEQGMEIAANKQDLTNARASLQSSLTDQANSINGMSGAIAKDHTQLVALEQQGERDYYEFDLQKAKRFQREGPISIELRRTNTKHQNYNMILLVDDQKLTKKNVDLYEPVTFEMDQSPVPLQLVVNKITKNHVHGYVSAPKEHEAQASHSPAASGSAPTTGASNVPPAVSLTAPPNASALSHP
jgi:hypothetical protein